MQKLYHLKILTTKPKEVLKMNNLERLKLELSNKEYYTDTEYTVFLQENELQATDVYTKANYKQLLFTVIQILETLCNDTDLMRKIDSKEIESIDQAFKFLRLRIQDIKNKISTLPTEGQQHSNIKLMFTRRR